jgi:hypothetical protein
MMDVCALKVAGEEFQSAPQAQMPTVVSQQTDFITHWESTETAALFATDVVQVDGVLRPMAAKSIVQVDTAA